jgi:hypothetical protein
VSWSVGPTLSSVPVALQEGELRAAIVAWLSKESFPPSTLFGTCDAGHLAGRWTGRALVLGADARPALGPALERLTLHSLRVFCREAELRVWSKGGKLCAAHVCEQEGDDPDRTTETQRYLLLGKRSDSVRVDGVEFSVLLGEAGERHAVPMVGERARLCVRHYRRFEPEAGAWRLVGTRWLELEVS